MVKDFKGDFLGFTFNNRHSSEFNIVRVINGSRQEENLLPSQKDTTITVSGRPGTLYIKRDFQNNEFKIDFAYDNLTEDLLSEMRLWLSVDQECSLVYDERPYKKYMVKPKSSPKLSYIAFNAPDGSRVYRGEGSVQFTAFYPYARACKLYYENETDQWVSGSGLKDKSKWNNYDKVENGTATLYNPGQIETPIYLAFQKGTYTADNSEETIITLGDQTLSLKTSELVTALETQHVLIDSDNHLILGVNEIEYTTNTLTYKMGSNVKVLNNLIKAGDFLVLPVSGEDQVLKIKNPAQLSFYSNDGKNIFYDYLYY